MDHASSYLLQSLIMLWWAIVGIIAFALGSWLFDKLDPIDYQKEISNGNVAAAIKFSAVLLGLAAIVVTALH